VKQIEESNGILQSNSKIEPIVIAYNDTVTVTNLASIARTNAAGSTNFVKGKQVLFQCDFHKETHV
jgi:hypothetical protein